MQSMRRCVLWACVLLMGLAARGGTSGVAHASTNFGAFNALLSHIVFDLGDKTLKIHPVIESSDCGLSCIDATISNIRCHDLSIGELELAVGKISQNQKSLGLTVTLGQVGVACSCQWQYHYIWQGNGDATAGIDAAHGLGMRTAISLASTDFRTHPPAASTLTVGTPAVFTNGIAGVHFTHKMGFTSTNAGGHILPLFKNHVQEAVEKQLTALATGQLASLGTSSLRSVIKDMNAALHPYLVFAEHPTAAPDALLAEHQLAAAHPPPLVDLPHNYVVHLAQLAVAKLAAAKKSGNSLVINQVVEALLPGGRLRLDDLLVGKVQGLNRTLIDSTNELFRTRVELTKLSLVGLDTLQRFDILRTIGAYTIQNDLQWAELGLEAELMLTLLPIDGGAIITTDERIFAREPLSATVRVSDVTLSAAGLLAVEKTLRVVSLYSLAHTPLQCFFSHVFQAGITYANATIGELHQPTLSGFESKGFDQLYSDLANAIFVMYSEVLHTLLPNIIQEQVRGMLNNLTQSYMDAPPHTACALRPAPTPGQPLGMFDFIGDSKLLTQAAWLLNTAVGPVRLNAGIRQLCPSGLYAVAGPLIDWSTTVHNGKSSCLTCGNLGRLSLRVSALRISGLDSLSSMALLVPHSPQTLNSTLLLAEASPIQLRVHLRLAANSNILHVLDDFELVINMSHVAFFVQLLLEVDAARLWNMRLDQLLDADAWLGTLAAARPTKLQLVLGRVGIELQCKNCTSPGLLEMARRARDEHDIEALTTAINQALASIARVFVNGRKARARMAEEVHAYRVYGTAGGGSNAPVNDMGKCVDHNAALCPTWAALGQCKLFPIFMLRSCRHACDACPKGLNAPAPSVAPTVESSMSQLEGNAGARVIVAGLGLGTGLMLVALCLGARNRQKRRRTTRRIAEDIKAPLMVSHVSQLLSHSTMDAVSVGITTNSVSVTAETLSQVDEVGEHEGVEVDGHERTPGGRRRPIGHSLLCSAGEVPWQVRYGMVVTILACIAIFMVGFLSIGAAVDVRIGFMGNDVDLFEVFEFSLGFSLHEMWTAGAIPLALLIGAFSGVWPYVKLILLMLCWCTPPRLLPVRKRAWLLHLLHAVGKWSFVDLFVLTMTMTAFALHITSPTALELIPPNFYDARMRVTPVLGLYCFTAGVVFSIVANHVAITYHDRVVRSSTKAADVDTSDDTAHESLMTETPQPPAPPLERLEGAGQTSPLLADSSPEEDQSGRTATIYSDLDSVQRTERREAVWDHVFEPETSAERFSLRRRTRVGVLLGVLLAWVLTAAGCRLCVFEFRMQGVVGMALELAAPGSSVKPVSLLSMVGVILSQAPSRYGGFVGIASLVSVFVFCTIIVPLLSMAVLGVLWAVGLTVRQARTAVWLLHSLDAWASLEVFLLATLVSLLEIGQVSRFMVDGACDAFQDAFQELKSWGFLSESQAQCFHIYAALRYEALCLLFACILTRLVRGIVIPLSEQAVRERERIERDCQCSTGAIPAAEDAAHVQAVQRWLTRCGGLVAWEKGRDLDMFSTVGISGNGWFSDMPGNGGAQDDASVAAASPASQAGLLAGWSPASWGEKTYYWNTETQETTWQRPVANGEFLGSTVSLQSLEGSDAAALAQRAVALDRDGDHDQAASAYLLAARALEASAEVASGDIVTQLQDRARAYRERAMALSSDVE